MRTLVPLITTALPFVITPGASFTITVTSAAGGDRLSALKVWAGTTAGAAVLALLVPLTGIGGVLASSASARSTFAAVGGCVLAVFGALILRRELHPGARRPHANPEPQSQPQSVRLVVWAFLALMTNVKALTLYVLVVPALDDNAVADVGAAGVGLYLAFGAVHMSMLLGWLLLVAHLITRVPARRAGQVRRVLGVLGGAFMFVLGVQSLLRV